MFVECAKGEKFVVGGTILCLPQTNGSLVVYQYVVVVEIVVRVPPLVIIQITFYIGGGCSSVSCRTSRKSKKGQNGFTAYIIGVNQSCCDCEGRHAFLQFCHLSRTKTRRAFRFSATAEADTHTHIIMDLRRARH
jgi:hypothetical protein